MNRLQLQITAAALALLLGAPGALARTGADNFQMMVQGYDLLEAGKLGQAQKLYEQVLREDPGNPMALNNLGAIMVKKKNGRLGNPSLSNGKCIVIRGARVQ